MGRIVMVRRYDQERWDEYWKYWRQGNGVRLSLYTLGGRRLCYAKVKAEPVFLSRHAKV